MPEINLASTSGIVKDNKNHIIFFAISAVILIGSISALVFFKIQKNNMQQEYKESADKVNNLQEAVEMSEDVEMMLSLQEQVEEIEIALSNHPYWSDILKFLEEQTISTVWYSNMTSSIEDGAVVLNAHAGSLMDIAKQLVNFNKNKDIISVSVDGINRGTNGKVAFNVTLNLENYILMRNKKSQEDENEN